MKVDSVDELRLAFAQWRRGKRHVREAVPEELLARARRAAKQHGVTAVVSVTRIERARLFRTTPTRTRAQEGTYGRPQAAPGPVPLFSRLELCAPSAQSARPVAEVETMSGVTLRVFEPTREMLGLLSVVCGVGGAR